MTAPDPRPEPGPNADKDDIQADIEQTRAELGETVEALSAKLDVKERAKEKVDETKERAKDKVHETKERVVERADTLRHTATDDPKRAMPVVAAVAVLALIGIIVWRRRR
jgi:MYXO-CTERM domain-containing protein